MSDPETTSDPDKINATRSRLADLGPHQFWRSLDEAAATPEFEKYLHREFPSQLAVWDDPVGRRSFLKLMAASLALAGVTGCTRSPEEKIVPYVRSPEELIPGQPQFYATAMPRGGYGYGVLAESHQGRPTKIEGNPEHPLSRGGTDAFMQASILSLYDPDRSQTILHRGVIETWEAFVSAMATEMAKQRKQQGRGLRILTGTVTSPTLAAQLADLLQALPQAKWHTFEPSAADSVQAGARLAFGRSVDTVLHFDQARVIVALDCDFLSALPASLQYARDFIDARRVATDSRTMNRLYVAECTPSLTGAMADHRIPLVPSRIETLARHMLQHLKSGTSIDPTQVPEGIPIPWLTAVMEDLLKHRGASLVAVGPGHPAHVQALVHAINQVLGNVGSTVTYIDPVVAAPSSAGSTLRDLVADMAGGNVQALIILQGNPVYNTPGELAFASQLDKVPLRIHLSDYYDETSFFCDWHIPAEHYLESWSDIRAPDGTASIVQPLITPLYDGKSPHIILDVLMGKPGGTAHEIVQGYWKQRLAGEAFPQRWRKALHDGVIENTSSKPIDVKLQSGSDAVPGAVGSRPIDKASFEIDFRFDPTVWDGQYANNGWLQELPKPLTKITWDNVAAISPTMAEQLKVSSGDLLEITVDGRSLQAPVWIMPGQADRCVSLTFGYGRTQAGHIGTGRGYNAYSILPEREGWFHSGTVRKIAGHQILATTQHHHNMEGRDIVRVTTLDMVQHPPETTHQADPAESMYAGFKYEGNAWGMVIDQTACIGCNACVVACQAENNIPVVGKEQVAVGREMHWLRIDRYYHGPLDDPETYFQPMMCVHCEEAPCEVVCPVAATVHDSEGTSNMIYNRCVGTRYCSNNCPYKVRRFNYLQFADETTPSLKLLRNPDVTVRSRGVMEKCSYCIQRISAARIDAKIEHLPLVPEGGVVTACQQACPTRAITFGNLANRESEVRKLKSSPLNYGVLAELKTLPRTTYLARVVNPHPSLPTPGAVDAHRVTTGKVEP
ncbi:MAG: molybdopterin oxidoreductase, iron-sulfur binding subunit [Planctomycetaceae bacterium]|nr:molybdopterin oxidoreductase, iron-sulfur binding subunit [Planctomycetaceae bacterium]